MITKEFIKIGKILDQYGLHKQADDLLKIAQLITKNNTTYRPDSSKSNPANALNTTLINQDPKKLDYIYGKDFDVRKTSYNTIIQNLTKNEGDKKRASYLAKILEDQYKTNKLDYASYKKIHEKLVAKASENGYPLQNPNPIAPLHPEAFPDQNQINEIPIIGRGVGQYSGQAIPIEMATPLEGLTAAGEKALPNREDRNLPVLNQEWNDYFKTDDFKTSIQNRINEIEANNKVNGTNGYYRIELDNTYIYKNGTYSTNGGLYILIITQNGLNSLPLNDITIYKS